MFSEAGTAWIPINDNTDYLPENDIIGSYDKKRIREPNDILYNNDIIRLDNNVKFLDKGSYDEVLDKDSSAEKNLVDKEPYNGIKFLEKEPYDGMKYFNKDPYEGSNFLNKELTSDEKYLDKGIYNGIDRLDQTPQRGVMLLGNEQHYNDDSKEMDMDLTSKEVPGYEAVQLDDEDKNFRWNYKHINRGIDDDITRFSRGHKDGRTRIVQPKKTKNINGKDVEYK